jgi:hypothetical protein
MRRLRNEPTLENISSDGTVGCIFDPRRRRKAKIREAVQAILLCVGAVLIPSLLALDGTVWLGCQKINTSECVDMLLIATRATAQQ